MRPMMTDMMPRMQQMHQGGMHRAMMPQEEPSPEERQAALKKAIQQQAVQTKKLSEEVQNVPRR